MIIYGEILFLENMIIGGVLLYLTGEICGQAHRIRLFAGSVMCGAFSLVIFTGAKGATLVLMETLFAVAVCAVVFGKWRKAMVFILVTYFMGGIVMGLLLLTKQQGIYTAAGIYTGDMKAAMLAVFICLGYMTVIRVIRTVKNKKLYEENSFVAVISFGEETIEVRAFLDTGNHLAEPITGRPVAVASETLWERLKGHIPERYAVIPYEAVGTAGILDAVRTDSITIKEKKIKGCYIAGSNGQFKLGSSHSNQDENRWELLLPAGITEY